VAGAGPGGRALEAAGGSGCSTSGGASTSTSGPSLTLNLTSQLLDSMAQRVASMPSLGHLAGSAEAHLPDLSVQEGLDKEREQEQLLLGEHQRRRAEGNPALLQAHLAAAARDAGPTASSTATASLFHQLLDTKPLASPLLAGLAQGSLPSSSNSSSMAGSGLRCTPRPRALPQGPHGRRQAKVPSKGRGRGRGKGRGCRYRREGRRGASAGQPLLRCWAQERQVWVQGRHWGRRSTTAGGAPAGLSWGCPGLPRAGHG